MRHFILSIALAGALVLGCGEQPAPSEPTSIRPLARTEQNPDGPGARVFRFNDRFAWVIVDFERGLTVVLGATPEEHFAACESGIAPEEASFKVVVRPGEVLKALVKGVRMGVTVWPAASGDICGELMAVPILAAGTARVRYTDNDLFLSRTRTNSFGVVANGTVTSLDTGDELRLLAKFHAIIFRNGGDRVTSSEVRLTPTGP